MPGQVPCCETRMHGASPGTAGGNESLSSIYGKCRFFLQIRSSLRRTCGAAGMPAPLPGTAAVSVGRHTGRSVPSTPAWTPAVRCSTRTSRPEEGFPLLASPQHLHAAQGRITSLQLQDTKEFFSFLRATLPQPQKKALGLSCALPSYAENINQLHVSLCCPLWWEK